MQCIYALPVSLTSVEAELSCHSSSFSQKHAVSGLPLHTHLWSLPTCLSLLLSRFASCTVKSPFVPFSRPKLALPVWSTQSLFKRCFANISPLCFLPCINSIFSNLSPQKTWRRLLRMGLLLPTLSWQDLSMSWQSLMTNLLYIVDERVQSKNRIKATLPQKIYPTHTTKLEQRSCMHAEFLTHDINAERGLFSMLTQQMLLHWSQWR